jgi:hypothetical protein
MTAPGEEGGGPGITARTVLGTGTGALEERPRGRRTLDVVLPVIRYTLARLVLFVLAVTVLGVLGAGREVALLAGLVVSVLLSYVLLRPWRDAATVAIVDRARARSERRRAALADEDALVEDAQVDALDRARRDADA